MENLRERSKFHTPRLRKLGYALFMICFAAWIGYFASGIIYGFSVVPKSFDGAVQVWAEWTGYTIFAIAISLIILVIGKPRFAFITFFMLIAGSVYLMRPLTETPQFTPPNPTEQNFGAEGAITNDEWTADDKNAAQFSCAQTIVQSNKFTIEYAQTYCQCIFGAIYPRWSHEELENNAQLINEELGKEGVLAKCLQAADKTRIDALTRRTDEAGMPDSFLGIKLNSTIEAAKAIRPHLNENNGLLEETAEWNGKKYDVSYAINPFSKSIFFISLERLSNRNSYMDTNLYLNSQYGQLSPPTPQGVWSLKSERIAGGIKLSHFLSDEGAGQMREKITLTRARD